MLQGYTGKDIQVAGISGDDVSTLATMVNAWLNTNNSKEVLDIVFQYGEKAAALIIHKASPTAPKKFMVG